MYYLYNLNDILITIFKRSITTDGSNIMVLSFDAYYQIGSHDTFEMSFTCTKNGFLCSFLPVMQAKLIYI